MRLKKTADIRTQRRYVERHKKFKHDCNKLGCSKKKGFEAGCGKW